MTSRTILICLLVCSMLPAVDNKLLAQPVRETAYLHFDRTEYDIGETAWFRAYVVSDHQFSSRSTVLWTDLLDPSGRLVQRVVFEDIDQSAYTDLPFQPRVLFYSARVDQSGLLQSFDECFAEKQSCE